MWLLGEGEEALGGSVREKKKSSQGRGAVGLVLGKKNQTPGGAAVFGIS